MKHINVLSLFDGISCGQVALERAGIKVENYFASEIDKYAIQITQKNYPNTIQLGDVCKYQDWDLPQIDILIGGSPCQGFSFAGKQLNFKDERSRLFFEYVKCLKRFNPKYFLLENVNMKQEYQDVISEYLGVKPIRINSKLVSAQHRDRLYWTNIPNISQPQDKNILLNDILENGMGCIVTKQGKQIDKIGIEKSYCLMARDYKGFGNQSMTGKLLDGELCRLSPLEYERLQTLPDNYTYGISNTQRYKSLGNGWTVDIISHILKYIHIAENNSQKTA